MTEAEWLTCTEPTPMLEFLKGKGSQRKLRLFSVACCRRIWRFLKDAHSRAAVEASERFADKLLMRPELLAAQQEAMLGNQRFDEYIYPAENAAASVSRPSIKPHWIAQLATRAVGNRAIIGVGTVEGRHASRVEAHVKESLAQAALVREIFGPLPFYPVTTHSAWVTALVKQLANAVYEERTLDRLSILADALEDAGCTNADILAHCRQPGEHVRGCWVVDLLLGKE